MDYQSVLRAVESLPIDDRIRLVQDVWERLGDQGHELELTEEMKAELDRRVEELDRNPDAGIPWDVVKARALGHPAGWNSSCGPGSSTPRPSSPARSPRWPSLRLP